MLKEQVAIVTGSSRGIGLSIAKHLASMGANVVLCARNQDLVNEVANEIEKTYKVKTLGVSLDINDLDAIKQLTDQTIKTFGKIDILINNAGITADKLLMRMSEEDWESVISTNLSSVFKMTKSVIRYMIKQKYGRIINVTSVVGVIGNPGQSNYAASKAGIIGFTKSIAKEVGIKNITCNAIAPGFIETDMVKSLPEEYINNIIKTIPLGRLGKPEEISETVGFLASSGSSYLTGKVISVDGGIS
ncbi:beta-ketoacyl-ACP reductase [Candidatus Marinamargulisbacteria bacterium SCGC AG-410-N11]|nr:beta-ketoacyl-ACP reductase [Candidatus Marinamargulisbacteria bacterium SCGC AG-410-N11]